MIDKPYLTKKQVAKIKRYLKSKEWADDLKKMQQKWKEDDEREERKRLEEIEWWMRIKDEPYTI